MRLLLPLFLLFVMGIFPCCLAQEVIPLYEGKAPGSENWTWTEQISTENAFNTDLIYNVVEPSLTAYLPPYYLATATAVIIAPGGAFHTLSINNEGIEVAKWLNSKGIAAFVLKYRLVRCMTDDPVAEIGEKMQDSQSFDEGNAPIVRLAMADGLAAVKYVRDHAQEFDIHPDKIGFMGFSAGGTLSMSVVYNADDSNRPNFVAPIYAYEPAIIGSTVPSARTPIFVAVAGDDQLEMTSHSLNIYQKWYQAGQAAELHIYEKGGHGFGMHKQNLPTDTWHDRFWEWLKLNGHFKRLYPSKYEKLYGEEGVEQGNLANFERMKEDYAYLSRYQDENQALAPPKADEKRVVFFGNSITEGWVRTDPDFFSQNDYVGRGISGQTSAQLLLRFRQDVLALQPKVVVIHIGTNDVAENTGPYNPAFTLGNIQSMVELAQANDIEVVLAAVLPATKFEWRRSLGDRSDMIVDLNHRLKAYAEQNAIPFIDYHTAMKNDQNGMDTPLSADGVHPTPLGFEMMAKMAKSTLDQLLAE
ncbi:MAG: GDSL-type esterase/lipase family protein [Bacteroidia bacterium]